MNISPINNNADLNIPVFSGRMIKKGFGWTNNLSQAYSRFTELNNFAQNRDIVARISTKKVHSKYDSNHYRGQTIYKLKLSFLKEHSLKEKVKDLLGLIPRHSLTRNYHSEYELINRFNKEYADKLSKKL